MAVSEEYLIMRSTYCLGCGVVGGGGWGMAIEQFVTKWVERVTVTALYSVTCNLKFV